MNCVLNQRVFIYNNFNGENKAIRWFLEITCLVLTLNTDCLTLFCKFTLLQTFNYKNESIKFGVLLYYILLRSIQNVIVKISYKYTCREECILMEDKLNYSEYTHL